MIGVEHSPDLPASPFLNPGVAFDKRRNGLDLLRRIVLARIKTHVAITVNARPDGFFAERRVEAADGQQRGAPLDRRLQDDVPPPAHERGGGEILDPDGDEDAAEGVVIDIVHRGDGDGGGGGGGGSSVGVGVGVNETEGLLLPLVFLRRGIGIWIGIGIGTRGTLHGGAVVALETLGVVAPWVVRIAVVAHGTVHARVRACVRACVRVCMCEYLELLVAALLDERLADEPEPERREEPAADEPRLGLGFRV